MNYPMQNSLDNILSNHTVTTSSDQSYFQKFFSQDFQTNTKKALMADYKHFLNWYVTNNKEPFRFTRLTERDVVSYKQYCQQIGNAVATINRRITHLRMLCEFAVKEGRMKENIAKKVKLLKVQRLAPKSLEISDLRKIMKEAELRRKKRDMLIIEMLAGGGFRVSELAGLKIEDITLSERKGHVIVRNGKGGKTREVPLNSRVRELLAPYIANRSPSENLFQSQRKGNFLTTLAFNKIIDFYAKKAGIKCHPHQFRHTFSYSYLAQTQNDLVGLSQILGHSNLTTTARYAQNRLSDLQEKVEGMVY